MSQRSFLPLNMYMNISRALIDLLQYLQDPGRLRIDCIEYIRTMANVMLGVSLYLICFLNIKAMLNILSTV